MKRRPKKPVASPLTREDRIEVRGRVRAAICLRGGGMEVFGDVQNLSEGGMYLLITERFPQECACECRLVMKGGGEEIFVSGWVAHVKERGMAVQFDDPDRETRLAIRAIMDRVAASAT